MCIAQALWMIFLGSIFFLAISRTCRRLVFIQHLHSWNILKVLFGFFQCDPKHAVFGIKKVVDYVEVICVLFVFSWVNKLQFQVLARYKLAAKVPAQRVLPLLIPHNFCVLNYIDDFWHLDLQSDKALWNFVQANLSAHGPDFHQITELVL